MADPTTGRRSAGLTAENHLPRWAVVALVALTVAAAAALWAHAIALNASSRAAGPGELVDRADSAVLATRLEPWSSEYRRRAAVLALWAQGQAALDSGDYSRAVDVLGEAYRLDVGNADLLRVFRAAQAELALSTNRKAHLQHGHEGPGGTLQPEDVER